MAPGGESGIGSSGDPQFYLDQGVPEGRLLLTIRWTLSGIADTFEVQAGEVELLENNGLTPPEEPGAETKLFVSGRLRTSSWLPVRGEVVLRIHWDDCDRHHVHYEITTTDVNGFFQQELTLREGIFQACVTALIHTFNLDDEPSRIAGVGELRLQRPTASGAPRDSLYVDVVF